MPRPSLSDNAAASIEGRHPWRTSPDGQTLTLSYKGGEKKIVVSSDTPIVSIAPGDRTDLKPGTKICRGG